MVVSHDGNIILFSTVGCQGTSIGQAFWPYGTFGFWCLTCFCVFSLAFLNSGTCQARRHLTGFFVTQCHVTVGSWMVRWPLRVLSCGGRTRTHVDFRKSRRYSTISYWGTIFAQTGFYGTSCSMTGCKCDVRFRISRTRTSSSLYHNVFQSRSLSICVFFIPWTFAGRL